MYKEHSFFLFKIENVPASFPNKTYCNLDDNPKVMELTWIIYYLNTLTQTNYVNTLTQLPQGA